MNTLLYNNIVKKYNQFKSHLGMYLQYPTYNNIVSFLIGMNHMSDNIFLDKFKEWICKKFNINSSFYWDVLIKSLYCGDLNECKGLDKKCLDSLISNKTDIEFLFYLIDEYIEERYVLPHSSVQMDKTLRGRR